MFRVLLYKVSLNLKGAMENIQVKALRQFAIEIEKRLSFDSQLLPALCAKGIITILEGDRIKTEGKISVDKTRRLLEILRRKVHPENPVFEQFCKVLEQDKQEPLAQDLREEVEKIKRGENSADLKIHSLPSGSCKRKISDREAVPVQNAPSGSNKRTYDYSEASSSTYFAPAWRVDNKEGEEEMEQTDDEDIDIPDGPDVTVKVNQSTEDFYSKTYNGKEVYDMKGRQKGKALIINITKDKSRRPRTGTKFDCKNLEELWKQLGFRVTVHKDLDAHGIQEKIREFAEGDGLNEAKCVIVCILSHGNTEGICGKDGSTVPIRNLLKLLDNQNCPALQNKPKLWFFQACRGGLADSGVPFENVSDTSEDNEENEADEKTQQATLTDYLIAYPSQAGYKAWRNRTKGSRFIQAVVQVFQRHAAKQDLCAMLHKVNSIVSSYIAKKDGKKCQASEYVSGLRKMRLYLYPGI